MDGALGATAFLFYGSSADRMRGPLHPEVQYFSPGHEKMREAFIVTWTSHRDPQPFDSKVQQRRIHIVLLFLENGPVKWTCPIETQIRFDAESSSGDWLTDRNDCSATCHITLSTRRTDSVIGALIEALELFEPVLFLFSNSC